MSVVPHPDDPGTEIAVGHRRHRARLVDPVDRRNPEVEHAVNRLLRGQTNFVKSLFRLSRVYRPELLLADHAAPVAYEIPLPPQRIHEDRRRPASLYVHALRGRKGRAVDAATERFVEETRMEAPP